ncbi:MAG: urea carboxylase-associated family protein [Deltaproteobacteria bacterium]|nr:urea carboxylase-associated family protein [Deltaproteobacteria bacterium]
MISYGKQRFDLVLQPISGKAVAVHAGEVLRVIQLGGEQCVDFNACNLLDYKEKMDVGSSRGSTGFRPRKGDIIFSNPPRYRPMIGILEMPPSCQTDVLGRTCHATLYEMAFGLELHTSCQDTIAESISEYGLTPDDVHDSFNMWMNTEWDSTGRWWTVTNTGRKGDFVDLVAFFDILAVPVTCGSGDIRWTSNFSFKPLQIQIFEASAQTGAIVDQVNARHGGLKNQRTVDQFRVKEIKPDRELRPVPGWKPRFVNFPIQVENITVELSQAEYNKAESLQEQGLGNDVSDVVRRGVMIWCNKHLAARRQMKIVFP